MRALVTGCGRRLGFYLCEQLVAAGWQVTGSYRSERPELATLAALGVELVQADFGREEDVGKLIDVLAGPSGSGAGDPQRLGLRAAGN